MVCIVCLSAAPYLICGSPRSYKVLRKLQFWYLSLINNIYLFICMLASDTCSTASCQAGSRHERKETTFPYWRKRPNFYCLSLSFPKRFQMALWWFCVGWPGLSAVLWKPRAVRIESLIPVPHYCRSWVTSCCQNPTEFMSKLTSFSPLHPFNMMDIVKTSFFCA